MDRTIEDQVAEVRLRIDRLRGSEAAPRVRRHLGVVRDVEQTLGELRSRLDVAERSLDADVSDDWATFAAAVDAELRGWDSYLERLQTGVATRAWKAREDAEAAIGAVRRRRIAVDERLAQERNGAGRAWAERRKRVTEARDDLERQADELSAKLNRKEQGT
jgi:hypothetical protein